MAKNNLAAGIKGNTISYRLLIQLFFFIIIFLSSLERALEGSGVNIPFVSSASLHALCPFGGVVSIYRLVFEGSYVQKIHSSSLVLMALVFTLAIAFGPVFCGWVCPFGSIQEWTGRIGRKLFKRKYNTFIPKGIDRKLRYLRYILLALVLYNTAATARLVFQNFDPYFALFNFFTGEVAIAAYVILFAILVLSLFVERPWCKYACPYGALLGIFNTFRLVKLRRVESTCINCKKCDRACPMNIDVSKSGTVRNHQCISCMKCTSEANCPVPETVILSLKGQER